MLVLLKLLISKFLPGLTQFQKYYKKCEVWGGQGHETHKTEKGEENSLSNRAANVLAF